MNSIPLMPETVKTYEVNKFWFWYNRSSQKWKDIFTGGWRDYYKYPTEAAIRMCMSFAVQCQRDRRIVKNFLLFTPFYAQQDWSMELVDCIVDEACFPGTPLQVTAKIIALTFLVVEQERFTIVDLCSLTGYTSIVVKNCLPGLLNKGLISKVGRGSYTLVLTARNVYYLKHLLVSCYIDCSLIISVPQKGLLTKTHPKFYPLVPTPARPHVGKKFFTPQTKGVQHVMLKTSNQPATVQAHPLEVWGPLTYDLGSFLECVLDAPQGTAEGFTSPVRVRCPHPEHVDTSPSCSVFPQGNAYCHGCHRKWKDLEAIVASMVEGTYEEGTVEELEATMDILYPYIIGGGLVDKNTVTYQKIASHTTARKEVNKYELEDAIQHYAGNFAGSYFSHNWTDMSTYSAGQWEMLNLGFKPETLAAWHVYSFDVDPWFKVRIPLLAGGTQIVGEQALSTRQDRKRGAMKYFTSPGLEKSAYIYGPLDDSSTLMLVEGMKDAMMVWQRGWHNVGTTLGATLSDQQADFIAHKYKTVLMGYDNDKAGELGYQQAYQKLVARGVHVEKIFYHSNDPASASISDWRIGVIQACANSGGFCPSEVWDYETAGQWV